VAAFANAEEARAYSKGEAHGVALSVLEEKIEELREEWGEARSELGAARSELASLRGRVAQARASLGDRG